MADDLFQRARAMVTRSLVEAECDSPGSYWQGDEFYCLPPYRESSGIGSFHINSSGEWFDFSEGVGGDFIKLLERKYGISPREAAERIAGKSEVGSGAQTSRAPRPERTPREKKVKPVIPVPATAPKISLTTRTEWMREHHGDAVAGWIYHTASGEMAFRVIRFQKSNGEKVVLPFYFGDNGKWVQGQPYDTGRPLYNLHTLLRSTGPVLVVEGEKCADVELDGYTLTTWPGGAMGVTKADWSPLEGREVIVWPDADQPGSKAAAAIKNRLPNARVLTIRDKPDGWDIADAKADGLDLKSFIASALASETPKQAPQGGKGNGFFEVLGYDDQAYYFLKTRTRAMFSIGRGAFTSSKLGELAPIDWWTSCGMTTKEDTIRVAVAQDYLQTEAESAGRFKLDSLRGAGVWRDGDTFVVNDGRRIVTMDGQAHAYHEFKSEYRYVSSDSTFPGLVGPESTDQEGERLFMLFRAQRFVSSLHTVFAMGWCLIAPFGGVLAWRPHMWLNGESEVGKSWLLENVVFPLVGEFRLKGTGTKSTPASIKRVLNRDAKPVILEECEGKTDDSRRKVTALVELARDASTDTGAESTISVGATGFATFITRAMFFFTSIGVQIDDQAADTRFQKCDLSAKIDMKEKKAESKQFYGVMKDPARFRRRIFRSLPRIMEDTEKLREVLLETLGAQRAADQVAPVLAAAWAVMSKESIISEGGKMFIASVFGDLENQKDDQVKDEDAVIGTLLTTQIRMDDSTNRTIGEVLAGMHGTGDNDEKVALLGRHGLRVFLPRNPIKEVDGRNANKVLLAMATSDAPMKKLLMGTPYETSIDSQIKRHSLCLNSEKKAQVRIGPTSTRARLLDWAAFKEKYLRSDQEELGT